MITRKVSPPEPTAPVGDPFFCERFSENGRRMVDSLPIIVSFSSSFTKKAPVHRGFLGTGIVPTGELEGREDCLGTLRPMVLIVPTGELEGREDSPVCVVPTVTIVPTGELEGREDLTRQFTVLILIVPTGELEGREDL